MITRDFIRSHETEEQTLPEFLWRANWLWKIPSSVWGRQIGFIHSRFLFRLSGRFFDWRDPVHVTVHGVIDTAFTTHEKHFIVNINFTFNTNQTPPSHLIGQFCQTQDHWPGSGNIGKKSGLAVFMCSPGLSHDLVMQWKVPWLHVGIKCCLCYAANPHLTVPCNGTVRCSKWDCDCDKKSGRFHAPLNTKSPVNCLLHLSLFTAARGWSIAIQLGFGIISSTPAAHSSTIAQGLFHLTPWTLI